MSKFKNFLNIFQIVKEAPEYTTLTKTLKNSDSFKKMVYRIEDFKYNTQTKII
jgi:hypothetical protein